VYAVFLGLIQFLINPSFHYMSPKFFTNPEAFRKWLEKNHKTAAELVVGFHKIGTGKASLSWSQAVDQALCFGWIDGVRTSIDENSYKIRFTPRKPNSIWSAVNIKKMKVLTEQGHMQEAGLKAFHSRNEKKTNLYSHEKEAVELSAAFQKQFKAQKAAWQYFQALAPSYRKASVHWVMSAKQEATRLKRLEQLIAESAARTNQFKENKYNKK
jgi:uncharacterized protein YdeI (YjbR/CyaY-like superfamily)